MGELWPDAQAEVAEELGSGDPSAIVFSANTHDFIIRLVAACPRQGSKLRVLTGDGEFHSARRQFSRWREDGWFEPEIVAVEPYSDFSERFIDRARSGEHDLIFVSQMMFNSGRWMDRVSELAALARPEGPWVVIDGYHSFMAVERPFPADVAARAFYLAGGYKYAMAGEGMGLMHCPPGFGPRPPITGWYAEFEDLTLPPGMIGYAKDGSRFMGATFDASALYRFTANRRTLKAHGITTAVASGKVAGLHRLLLDAIAGTPLEQATLLNPLGEGPHARFLAFRHSDAQRWCNALLQRNCITDVRGDVLRIGFGIYHDEEDIDRFVTVASDIA